MLPPVDERGSAVRVSSADIEVRVALHADLRKYFDRSQVGPKTMRLPSGSKVEDLLALLGVEDRENVTVGVNGELAQHTAVLNNHDDIIMFSPMEGG